jgi:hypothetical protein
MREENNRRNRSFDFLIMPKYLTAIFGVVRVLTGRLEY